eukprot:TRINITY_DN704_c0_g2_i3.p1 TRINITY_DN704_c0_g2~~TRINITY_DN704_c0_g2_i3.p1  ORF type:complete len:372 (-),score=88.57 TRINITY_DN704_c0_g2_i3:654-1769(-)
MLVGAGLLRPASGTLPFTGKGSRTSCLDTSYRRSGPLLEQPTGPRSRSKTPLTVKSFSKQGSEQDSPSAPATKRPQISFGDQLLDYIEGGPKLRKWYGAPEQEERETGEEEGEKKGEEAGQGGSLGETSNGVRDVVLVADADDETGQLLVLALIVQRYRVRVIVRDPKAAMAAFGAYVEPVVLGLGGSEAERRKSVDAVLRDVRAVILSSSSSKVGLALVERCKQRGVEHVVLLSQALLGAAEGSSGGAKAGSNWASSLVDSLRGNAERRRQAESAEALIRATGVPFTFVRTGELRDAPGGEAQLRLSQEPVQVTGPLPSITREDAAEVCVQALGAQPQERQGVVVQVVNGSTPVTDWEASFKALQNEPAS